ncbi:MAG: thioredoxin family protein [Alphaproteobacteria bacterium]|nr:thioredoxin family protein [Alphaproteobacteria bacterium]
MKKNIIIFLFAILLYPSLLAAADVVFVENPDLPETPLKYPSFEDTVDNILSVSIYFNMKYPPEKMDEDMTDDILMIFPNMTRQKANYAQNYIKKGLNLYRYLKELYYEYKAKLLMPEDPPIVVADDQYADKPSSQEYIDTDSGTLVFVDIKKVVPYSQNPRDTKAIRAKFDRDINDHKHTFDGLVELFSKIEWKKLPFYDILYPSPFTGILGIGDWSFTDNVYMRILTENSGVQGLKTLRGVIDIKMPMDRYVVANDGLYLKPKINFENSENLDNWEISLPAPIRILTPDNQDRSAYIFGTAIPVTFYISEVDKPLRLNATIDFYFCTKENECSARSLSPSITLEANRSDNSSVSSFVYQKHLNIPQQTPKELTLNYFRSYKMPNNSEYIEASISSKEKISDLSVFINSPDRIAFESPRISIDGKNAIIKFLPQNSKTKLANKEFELTLYVNKNLYLQQTHGAQEYSIPPAQKPKINLKLILLAFLGGLILNLMPCVFPVLAIKIFSLTQFGATRSKNVRNNFCYTILGIFAGFALLSSFLALLKLFGRGIGWGMQFQNPYFVIIMIFAIMIFFLAVCGVVEIRTASFVKINTKDTQSGKILYFLTGTLAVLMSTPCTAPYLATAIGFALAGSITDIYAILMSVGAGLAFPYILFYVFPSLTGIMPTPGRWMHTLSNIMGIMLLLTIIWLFSILLAQTNIYLIIRLAIYIIISAILIWLNSINKEMEYDKDQHINNKIKKTIKVILLSIVGIFFLVSIVDAGIAHKSHQQQISATTENKLDMEKINQLVKEGKTVLVSIGAEWCLTCHYNNVTTMDLPSFQSVLKSLEVETINIDWTDYNKDVIDFMQKYHRNGLPFYILFSQLAPDGFVLPEILEEKKLENIIKNFTISQPDF